MSLHPTRSASPGIPPEPTLPSVPHTRWHKCSTAPHGDVEIRRFRVTHPYHPLFQQAFELPLSLEVARRLLEGYVEQYNNVRLNSATGYIPPKEMLAGRQQEIYADRDRKLDAARQQRQSHRQQAA